MSGISLFSGKITRLTNNRRESEKLAKDVCTQYDLLENLDNYDSYLELLWNEGNNLGYNEEGDYYSFTYIIDYTDGIIYKAVGYESSVEDREVAIVEKLKDSNGKDYYDCKMLQWHNGSSTINDFFLQQIEK